MARAIIEALDLPSLVPPVWSVHLSVIEAGLSAFLVALPGARLRQIWDAVRAMPAYVPAAARAVAVMRSCPALHKLGQVIAREERIDAAFRRRLQTLERLPATASAAEVAGRARAALAELRADGVTFGDSVLAEGSVAVVLPFELPGEPDGKRVRRAGVLKVLRAGIEEALAADLSALSAAAEAMDAAAWRGAGGSLDYAETFETVRELLRHEVDLRGERAALVEAREALAGMADVAVPEPMDPFCASVLSMTFLPGEKVTDAAADVRGSLARTVAKALIGACVLSDAESSMFHADPHAGNLIAMPDGRLGVIDWSLTGSLDRSVRRELARLMAAAVTLDAYGAKRSVAALAESGEEAVIGRVVDASFSRLGVSEMPGAGFLTRLLDACVSSGGVKLPASLLLFRKAMLSIEGVTRELGGGGALDAALWEAAFGALQREWPLRMASPLVSSAFGTNLSTLELWMGAARVPLSMMEYARRFWGGMPSASITDGGGRDADC